MSMACITFNYIKGVRMLATYLVSMLQSYNMIDLFCAFYNDVL
jgi:hypothetical protein